MSHRVRGAKQTLVALPPAALRMMTTGLPLPGGPRSALGTSLMSHKSRTAQPPYQRRLLRRRTTHLAAAATAKVAPAVTAAFRRVPATGSQSNHTAEGVGQMTVAVLTVSVEMMIARQRLLLHRESAVAKATARAARTAERAGSRVRATGSRIMHTVTSARRMQMANLALLVTKMTMTQRHS